MTSPENLKKAHTENQIFDKQAYEGYILKLASVRERSKVNQLCHFLECVSSKLKPKSTRRI